LISDPLLTAAEWARMMRAPLRDKAYQLTGLGPAVTDFLAWKRLDGAAERTLDQYERDLARACILYPEKTLETLTSEDILHVVTVFPPRSQKRARAALASMFRWAILWNRVDRNPMDRIPRAPQPPGRYVEVFTEAEVAALTNLDELRDRALMAVLFDAGLRKAEARHLRAGRCLLEDRRLVIVGGKGGKDRVIPMGERLTSSLAGLVLLEGLEDDDFVWYSRQGANQYGGRIERRKPIGEGTFHRWWERGLESAGVRYRNPHVARHTFATRWLRRGGRMETLSKAMGHASIATTVDLYSHLDLSDVARDLALVEAHGINPEQKEEL
jgi:integrase/recombinase XerD